MPRVGLGWLRGTSRADLDTIRATLRPFFGGATPRPGGTRWYRHSESMADGRVLLASEGAGGAAGTVMVDVTQTALDGLGWERSLDLARALVAVGLQPSRVDVFVDDRERHADPLDVMAAIRQGDTVTHAQGWEWRESGEGGATAYLGSRSSDRFLRVYRKGVNTDDPRTRWELEAKGENARDALRLLTDSHEPMTDLVRLLLGFVDFRARAGSKHGSRAPRLGWWVSLVGSLTGVKGVAAQVVDSLARRAGWLRRQVAPTLALLARHDDYGDVWLTELLFEGRRRQGGLAWAGS